LLSLLGMTQILLGEWTDAPMDTSVSRDDRIGQSGTSI
jgi:hypothetical protein